MLSLLIMLPVLVSVAYVTLVERKWLAVSQRRMGPNTVGMFGLMQPFSDALKLIGKENVLPKSSTKWWFYLAPMLSLLLSMMNWLVIPFNENKSLFDLNNQVMWNLLMSSLGIYGILLSGLGANSKYAYLGSLRSTAQMISYELVFMTCTMMVLLMSESFNYWSIMKYQLNIPFAMPLFIWYILYMIAVLAETNRAPFDLPEAESELVAGFFTEHSSLPFVMFFLAEYASMFFLSYWSIIMFWSDHLIWFNISLPIKTQFMIIWFVWIRSTLPRMRSDQLMKLCWSELLPIAWAGLILNISIIVLI